MYPGPLVRTYSSYAQYENDAANMAQFGIYATSVQKDRVTDGCVLTAILIIGLLLTPVCIGLLILLFIPKAFSTRVTVYYSQPLTPPTYPAHPALPSRQSAYPAPVTIPISHAYVYPHTHGSPQFDDRSPQWRGLLGKFAKEFMVEWRDVMEVFRAFSFVQQALWIIGIIAVVSAVLIVSVLFGQAIFHQ